jgi:hypothetical protein
MKITDLLHEAGLFAFVLKQNTCQFHLMAVLRSAEICQIPL